MYSLIHLLWGILRNFEVVVHIGKIIQDLVSKSDYSAQEVADYMTMSKSNLFSIYTRAEIDNYKLGKFSELLGVNLFEYSIEKDVLKKILNKEFSELEEQIIELESMLATKEKEVKDKDEIIAVLKKVVSLHEESKLKK